MRVSEGKVRVFALAVSLVLHSTALTVTATVGVRLLETTPPMVVEVEIVTAPAAKQPKPADLERSRGAGLGETSSRASDDIPGFPKPRAPENAPPGPEVRLPELAKEQISNVGADGKRSTRLNDERGEKPVPPPEPLAGMPVPKAMLEAKPAQPPPQVLAEPRPEAKPPPEKLALPPKSAQETKVASLKAPQPDSTKDARPDLGLEGQKAKVEQLRTPGEALSKEKAKQLDDKGQIVQQQPAPKPLGEDEAAVDQRGRARQEAQPLENGEPREAVKDARVCDQQKDGEKQDEAVAKPRVERREDESEASPAEGDSKKVLEQKGSPLPPGAPIELALLTPSPGDAGVAPPDPQGLDAARRAIAAARSLLEESLIEGGEPGARKAEAAALALAVAERALSGLQAPPSVSTDGVPQAARVLIEPEGSGAGSERGGAAIGGNGDLRHLVQERINHVAELVGTAAARRARATGVAIVRFRVNPEGYVDLVELVRSTGTEALDREVTGVLHLAEPYPRWRGWLKVAVPFGLPSSRTTVETMEPAKSPHP
jgi:TonB family protein